MHTLIRGTPGRARFLLLAREQPRRRRDADDPRKEAADQRIRRSRSGRVTGSAQERQQLEHGRGRPHCQRRHAPVIANGGTDSRQTFTLPSSGWSRIGSLGYKWSNRNQPRHPVRRASIKKTPERHLPAEDRRRRARAGSSRSSRRIPGRAGASSSASTAATATASASVDRRAVSARRTTPGSGW